MTDIHPNTNTCLELLLGFQHVILILNLEGS